MKNSIIAAVLSLATLLFISDFDFFNSLFWMPNLLWVLPLYVFFRLSVWYFKTVFSVQASVPIKLSIVAINIFLVFFLFKLGFNIWKVNQGNILLEEIKPFQMTLKNIWFWILFQSYLILLFFSAFKLLITIDQKK